MVEHPARSSAAGAASPRRAGWRRLLTRPPLEPVALETYRRERIRELLLPVAGALMEAGFVGVIADKVYAVDPFLLALITAAPMFGNLSSFFWARVADGRPKMRLLTALQAAFAAGVGAIALLPEGRVGGWLLALDVVAVRLLLGGVITVRSLVWTRNYPRAVRGRVTSRLALTATAVMAVTSLGGSAVLDASPASFRALYALGAVLAALGVVAHARVRLVGEEDGRPRLAPVRPRPEATDAPESTAPLEPSPPGGGMLALLRADPLYARYLGWQFLLGVSNMMVEGPLILLVSRELGAGYATSVALTLVVPLLLSMLTLPIWAVYLDRVHISEFRARHSWLWSLGQSLLFLGAHAGSLAWVAAGRVVLGVARGGGQLAWQLGHNDFAGPERAAHYMGLHVTLTGLRGAFAPFVGMLLYVGWRGTEVPVVGVSLPAWDGLGSGTMALAAALSALATLGFGALHRRIRREGRGVPGPEGSLG